MKRTVFTDTLLAALLVQTFLTVPAHALAGLRATACCAHCDHRCSLSDAMRCCGDAQLRDDSAAMPAVAKVAPNAVNIAAVVPETLRVSGSALAVDVPQRARGAPLFRLVESLRL